MRGRQVGRGLKRRIVGAGAMLLALAGCTDRPMAVAPALPSEADRLLVAVPQKYTDVSAGAQAGCGVSEDGKIRCWGLSSFGEAPPVVTATTGKFTTVRQAGNLFTCGLRDDGAVECFGRDRPNYPVLGVRTATAPHYFTQLSAGTNHVCALREDGVVECWGEDDAGQAPATKAAQSGHFVQVSAGGVHSCALRNDDVIECWGDETSQRGAAPATWSTSGGFVHVGTGIRHTCAVRADGSIQCVGDNFSGQAPSLLAPQTSTFVRVRGGNYQTCGLRADGVIECWGDNDPATNNAPATVSASAGTFASFDYEGLSGCGLRTDGVAECWGEVTGAYPSAPTTGRVQPAADLAVPATVIVNNSIALTFTNPRVPNYQTNPATFTYAFDCGSGYGTASATATGSCATSTVGSRTVKGKVIDRDGDFTEYSRTVTVLSAQEATQGLTTSISTTTLLPDLRKSLLAKLNAAIDAMNRGRKSSACSALADFIGQVTAQRGKAIPVATADAWLLTARQLRTSLGC